MPPKLPNKPPSRQVKEQHTKTPDRMAPTKDKKLRKHKRKHRNAKQEKEMTTRKASGDASPSVEYEKTNDKSQNKSKGAKTRSRQGRRKHRWGRIRDAQISRNRRVIQRTQAR